MKIKFKMPIEKAVPINVAGIRWNDIELENEEMDGLFLKIVFDSTV